MDHRRDHFGERGDDRRVDQIEFGQKLPCQQEQQDCAITPEQPAKRPYGGMETMADPANQRNRAPSQLGPDSRRLIGERARQGERVRAGERYRFDSVNPGREKAAQDGTIREQRGAGSTASP